MKKSNTTTNTALVEALVYNNRFASAKVDGEQIGVANFAEWKNLVNNLHRAVQLAVLRRCFAICFLHKVYINSCFYCFNRVV